jgi:hypothetical protein
MGMLLGLLLLSSKFADLSKITRLPDVLERLGLPMARVALLKMLGHEDTMRSEGTIPAAEDESQVREFFADWTAMREKYQIADNPDFLLTSRVELRSIVVGCEWVLSVENDVTAIHIAESFLGAIESLFSTSLDQQIFPRIQRFEVSFNATAGHSGLPSLSFHSTEGPTYAIVEHAKSLNFNSEDGLKAYSIWLRDAVLEITFRAYAFADADEWYRQVVEIEKGFSRAITFSNVPLMSRNVFGNAEKTNLIDWVLPDDIEYEVRSTEPMNSAPPERTNKPKAPPKFGKGEPPKGMFDINKVKHSDYQVQQL